MRPCVFPLRLHVCGGRPLPFFKSQSTRPVVGCPGAMAESLGARILTAEADQKETQNLYGGQGQRVAEAGGPGAVGEMGSASSSLLGGLVRLPGQGWWFSHPDTAS